MFDNLDLNKMQEMIGSLKDKVEAYESEVASKTYEAKAGGGMVSVKINGNCEIQDINFDDELLSDKQSLQILLISAVNDAINLANEEKKPIRVMDYSEGGFFGELALLNNAPRAASIIAETDCNLVYMDRGAFKRLLGPLEDLLQRNAEKYKKFMTKKGK